MIKFKCFNIDKAVVLCIEDIDINYFRGLKAIDIINDVYILMKAGYKSDIPYKMNSLYITLHYITLHGLNEEPLWSDFYNREKDQIDNYYVSLTIGQSYITMRSVADAEAMALLICNSFSELCNAYMKFTYPSTLSYKFL